MPARILYVEGNTDGTVGGSYYILLDLVLGLDRSRYEPIVVFGNDNIVAEQMRAGGIRVVIQPPVRPLVFRRRWMNLVLGPLKRAVNFLRGFCLLALRRRRFLHEERIDLVNLNNSVTENQPWMVAAMLAGVPCVTHQMGIPERYSFLSRYLGARLKAVYCLSQAILDAMRAKGVSFPHAIVIHSVFNTKRYQLKEPPETLRERYGIPVGAPVVGVVGNIKEWKGQETLVRALALLSDRHPTVRCILAGASAPRDEYYRARVEAVAQELGVADRVIFTGFQRNAIDYMNLMDVVVHTSTSPEPFGIVLLEAMLLSKPLISTTIGGPAEIVLHGTTGLLVEPGDAALLADAIDRMLGDPQSAMEMGRRGHERLLSEFSLERTLRETSASYDRILAPRRGSAIA